MKKDDNGSISRGKFLAAVPVLWRPCRCCDAASPERRRNRQLGSGDERGKTVRGQVLELDGVLTAKFLTQLTGLLVIQARLGEITPLAILESETTISGRIVRVHLDRFLVSFNGTCRVPGFRVRKPQVVI